MTVCDEGFERACQMVLDAARAAAHTFEKRRADCATAAAPSSATLADYRRIFLRLEAERRERATAPSAFAARSARQSTWMKLRSAYLYCAHERLRELARNLANTTGASLAPTGNAAPGARVAAFDALLELLAAAYSFEAGMPARRRMRARRTCIEGLPPDWREQLALVLPERIRCAYLVAALTGCRPAELAAGITVRIVREEGRDVLEFSIAGAKVGARRGQPRRVLCWPVHCNTLCTLLCNQLAHRQADAGDDATHLVRLARVDQLSELMNRHSARLWPGQALSAYALRYQFATDLEQGGVSAARIASALGHCITDSQTCYRPRRRSAGVARGPALDITRIEASRSVRDRYAERAVERQRAAALERERHHQPHLERC